MIQGQRCHYFIYNKSEDFIFISLICSKSQNDKKNVMSYDNLKIIYKESSHCYKFLIIIFRCWISKISFIDKKINK